MKKVILLCEQDIKFWSHNTKWKIDHSITVESFISGNFTITDMNPRITYRDFTFLAPIFVEVELEENQEWVPLRAITACHCKKEWLDRQKELFIECVGESSHTKISPWSQTIDDLVDKWRINQGLGDAFQGGDNIIEMLFTPHRDTHAIRQWITVDQRGETPSLEASPLCHVLTYRRDHIKSGIIGAITDLGVSLKALKSKNKTVSEVLDILRSHSAKEPHKIPDCEVLDSIRSNICATDAPSEWKALTCPLILYFMLKEEVLHNGTFNFKTCQDFVKQWTEFGFYYEVKEACWFLGLKTRASNFSKQHTQWAIQKREEPLSRKEDTFQNKNRETSTSSNEQTLPQEANAIQTPVNSQDEDKPSTEKNHTETSTEEQVLPVENKQGNEASEESKTKGTPSCEQTLPQEVETIPIENSLDEDKPSTEKNHTETSTEEQVLPVENKQGNEASEESKTKGAPSCEQNNSDTAPKNEKKKGKAVSTKSKRSIKRSSQKKEPNKQENPSLQGELSL